MDADDVQSIRNTIDDWIDMKSDVQSLASLQFNQDRVVLNKIQSFRFRETELDIMLLDSDETTDRKYNESNEHTLSIEELESLNDRLLLYTTSASTNLINKEIPSW
eukprot:529418_1